MYVCMYAYSSEAVWTSEMVESGGTGRTLDRESLFVVTLGVVQSEYTHAIRNSRDEANVSIERQKKNVFQSAGANAFWQ